MSKENVSETAKDQKVVTKYDRKMEQRKKQKEIDRRQEKTFRITAVAVGAGLFVIVIGAILYSVYARYDAVHGTYVKIGNHEVSRLEYNFYYNTTVQSYLNSYGSLLPYMGLNTEEDFAKQMYSDTLTWKDMFDQMTVEQIKQIKALSDDIEKTGFTYDVAQEYKENEEGIAAAAKEAGISLSEYYERLAGKQATPGNLKPFMEEGMLAAHYYEKLLADNAVSEEEITQQYEENKEQYDKIDYYSYLFTTGLEADASEDEIAARMKEMKAEADAFVKERKDGVDFDTLCAEYADEADKENYEAPETEYSLQEGRYGSSIPATIKDWLFEESRKGGDIEVLENDGYHQYYVVEYVNRYFDEADRAGIGENLAQEKVTEYVVSITSDYEVTDVKGELAYLLIPETP